MKKLLIPVLVLVLFNTCSTGRQESISPVRVSTSTDYYNAAMDYARTFEASGFKDQQTYQKAIDYFEEVLFIEKLNADAWYNIGRVLFYGGEYSRAKESFRNAIRYRRNFVESYSLLTRTLLIEEKLDQATSVAEKAYENIPNNEIIMNDLATVYIKTERYDEAKDLVSSIIKKNSKFTPAYITLGNIFYIQKKYELARLVYLKAVDEGDDSGELYTNMGLVAMHTEDKDSTLNYFKKGVEKAVGNPYTHLNLANFFMSTGDYESAVAEFDLALKFSPMMIEAVIGEGAAYMQLKLLDKAEELYKKAISINPDYPETYFNYGILVADYRGDKSQAVSFFNKFIELKGALLDKGHRVYKYIEEIKAERIKPTKKARSKKKK